MVLHLLLINTSLVSQEVHSEKIKSCFSRYIRHLQSNEDHLQTTILKFQLITAAIFTKKRDFGNYQEMDSEHLQTSNSGLFVLMLLSLHKELHRRCSLGLRIHPCYFFRGFLKYSKYFPEHIGIYQYCDYQIILVESAKRLSYRNQYERQISLSLILN